MGFSKTFPKAVPGSNHPSWEEVCLSDEEEKAVESFCKQANFQLMDECIKEAKILAIKNGVNDDHNVALLAASLFDKRASHVVFWKELAAKEKFDKKSP